MKKAVALSIFCSLFLLSYTQQATSVQPSLALVEQRQGLCIFVKSKPVSEYTYLGSIRLKVVISGRPPEMIETMLRKVKKEYPEAEGIIYTTEDMDVIDVIKFKK